MHPFRHIAELFHAAATHLECRPPVAAPSSAEPGVTNMLTQILKETRTMSDKLTTLETKVDDLIASETAAHARVDARDALLVQATKDRDTAVASVAEAQSEIATLKGELAAIPVDTAAQEARLDTVLTKLDGVKTGLDGMELTPAADPAPEPTSATPPADTTLPPASVTTAPAETDPAAPTGPETTL